MLGDLGGKQVCTISVLLRVAVDGAGTCAPFTGQLCLLSCSLTRQAGFLPRDWLQCVGKQNA